MIFISSQKLDLALYSQGLKLNISENIFVMISNIIDITLGIIAYAISTNSHKLAQ